MCVWAQATTFSNLKLNSHRGSFQVNTQEEHQLYPLKHMVYLITHRLTVAGGTAASLIACFLEDLETVD